MPAPSASGARSSRRGHVVGTRSMSTSRSASSISRSQSVRLTDRNGLKPSGMRTTKSASTTPPRTTNFSSNFVQKERFNYSSNIYSSHPFSSSLYLQVRKLATPSAAPQSRPFTPPPSQRFPQPPPQPASSRTVDTPVSPSKVKVQEEHKAETSKQAAKEEAENKTDLEIVGKEIKKEVAKEKELIKQEKVAKEQTKEIEKKKEEVAPADKKKQKWSLERIWKVVKEEAHHYWVGTKVLGANIKITASFVRRIVKGEKLSRRERALLVRTVADLFRLVPFIVIVVVPFMEFSLPVLLKLFPNMLPSTYTSSKQKSTNIRNKLKVKSEVVKFLQETTEKMASDIKLEKIDAGVTFVEFADFMDKIKSGLYVSNEEILKFGKVFKEIFALDKLSRPQLVMMCKFFGLPTWGSDSYLRNVIRNKVVRLQRDDEVIKKEGTDSLSFEELIEAAVARGEKIEGRTREDLKQSLEEWIELNSASIPAYLLILSRSYRLGDQSQEIKATISSIPDAEIAKIVKELPEEVSKTEALTDALEDYKKAREDILKHTDEKDQEEEISHIIQDFRHSIAGIKSDQIDLKDIERSTPAALRLNSRLEKMIAELEALGQIVQAEDKDLQVSRVFKVFDKDNNGYISAQEFQRIMESLGENITEDEVKQWMKQIDTDGDGQITFDEFKKIMVQHEDKKKKPKEGQSTQQPPATQAPASTTAS